MLQTSPRHLHVQRHAVSLPTLVHRAGVSSRSLVPKLFVPARCAALTVARAKGDDKDDVVSGIVSAGNQLVDKVADFVPESVPRSVAKTGVAVVGGLIVFGLVQKVISGVLTLVVLGGLGYYFLTRDSKDDDVIDVSSSSKKRSSKDEDLDDPLAEARRIMDKYK